MVNFRILAPALLAGLLAVPNVSHAQDAGIPGFENVVAAIQERLAGNVYKLTGNVELSQPDMKFYADEVEYFGDTNRLVATGNVLVIQKDHQIAADRADFNAKTKLGIFYNARGFAAMGPQTDASAFGTLQPDVQFYGETLEKTGVDIYIISHGGFTTCTQANPRWMMTSGSLKLRVDHYAFLKNTLLKAKGFPVLYLPLMYYPLSKDNRSTGFLLPTYGSSTIQGQTISNGFFWAINRSQDATIQHDWYSQTGQQMAGEYRYVSLLGSGNLRTTFLNEQPRIYVSPDGSQSPQDGRKSYNLNGNLSQGLGRGWYGQARADYSSSQIVKQTYSTDIAALSSHNRILGGSVSGSVKTLRVTGTYDRNENFNPDGSSALRSNSPRVNISRPDRLIPSLPVYYSVGTDYVRLVNQGFDTSHVRTRKDDIDRLDIAPVLRFPYTRLPFLAVNTSLTWRNTFWSDSYLVVPRSDGSGINQIRQTNPISRRFFEMSADLSGPTVVRIWDAPTSRFKHTIEPFLQVTHRTAIDNYDQILKFEGTDWVVGNATSYSYGTNSRFYRKRTGDGPTAVPRELVSASIRQTYFTDANSIAHESDFRSTYGRDQTHFSPVQLNVRTSPTTEITGAFRTEFDGRYSKFRQFGADGTWNNERLSLQAGWSQDRFRPDNTGRNVSSRSHYFNSSSTVRFQQNRYGVIHNVNWDIRGKSILQQRIAGYYNAQCCGFTAEYQTVDLSRLGSRAPVPQDSRFHFSVTLAGIGNVSNIFGALGGTPNR